MIASAFQVAFLAVLLAVGTPDAGSPDSGSGGIDVPDLVKGKFGSPPAIPLETTDNPAQVKIRHLHIVLSRKGDHVLVSEVLTLACSSGKKFWTPFGYFIPFPDRAVAPGITGEQHERPDTKIETDGFRVHTPIPPGGLDVALRFELPIVRESVVLEQRLSSLLESGQIISTWTVNNARLEAKGFGKAALTELANGLTALVAMGRKVERKNLSVTLTGLNDDPGSIRRAITFALCVAFLLAGLVLWFLGRKRKAAAGVDLEDGKTGGDG